MCENRKEVILKKNTHKDPNLSLEKAFHDKSQTDYLPRPWK